MNRWQRHSLHLVFWPALAVAAAAAGTIAWLDAWRDWVFIAVAGGFAGLSYLGLASFEILIKTRSLGRWALLAEIIISSLLESAFIFGLFNACINSFGHLIQLTPLYIQISTIDQFRSSACLVGIILLLQIIISPGRIWGGRNVRRFLSGHFRKPRQHERFLVRISLLNHREIEGRFGVRVAMEWLNAFYLDLEKAAAQSGGELYRREADGALVHWRYIGGEANNSGIAFVFRLRQLLDNRANWYRDNFEYLPEFQAVMHFGDLALVELGWNSKEITLTGPALNIVAQLDTACARLKQFFLISEAAMDRLVLPAACRIHRTINARLRDETQEWRIYALEQIKS